MTDVNVKITDPELNAAMQAAILTAIGQRGQEQILSECIKYLTTKNEASRYGGNSTSPLQDIIYNSARKVADTTITEKLKGDPEFIQQIEIIYLEAVKKFLSVEKREDLLERMVNKMAQAFEERY